MQADVWVSRQHADDQRRFMNLLMGSFVAHVVLFAILSFAPSPDAPLLPEVLRVDLVASVPPALPKQAAAPPKPAPAPKSAPKVAPAPPPRPVPKQVMLPKQAPLAVPKKVVPKKVVRKVAPPPTRPEPLEYEDALSQLRNELGEAAPAPEAAPQVEVAPAPAPTASEGVAMDADLAAWVLAMKRHVRSKYITPPEFLNQSLATGLEVLLTSRGELVGMPKVTRPSGNPFFDDNAVRAVMMSAPLPAPPRPGSYPFMFTSERR